MKELQVTLQTFQRSFHDQIPDNASKYSEGWNKIHLLKPVKEYLSTHYIFTIELSEVLSYRIHASLSPLCKIIKKTTLQYFS
jgi:hypothetical protein